MNIIISELNWIQGIKILKKKGFNVLYDPHLWNNREKLLGAIENADALIVRNQTNVNKELLNKASSLKVIGRLGVGLDNIHLSTARERGIPVVYGRNSNAVSVAEYVINAIFNCSRMIQEASADVHKGGWNRKKFTGFEIYGKTLGLIGLGEISHRVATRAIALGMKVIGFDPFITSEAFIVGETGVQLMSLEQVIESSNFVSLHIPFNDATKNLVDLNLLKNMKQNAFIINTSRGGIINEHDLSHALRSNIISGAVLDVLEDEPPSKDHPLLGIENCIITPHIAGLTEESQIRVSKMIAHAVCLELEGKVSLYRKT